MKEAQPDNVVVFIADDTETTNLSASIASSARGERLYYLDWLRIVVVLGVFFAHGIDIFNFISPALKYQVQASGIMIATTFIAEWGMALFFLLAGASAWFSLEHRTWSHFLGERFRRLILPFLVGVLVLSPPQAYMEAARYSPQYKGSFFQFYVSFFQGIHIGWDLRWIAALSFHLWFLLFLFVISSLALPFLLIMRRKHYQQYLACIATFCERYNGLFIFVLPLVLLQAPLRLVFPGYQSWADFSSWLLFFLYGYLLVAHPQFTSALCKQRGIIVLTAVACPLVLLMLYSMGFIEIWEHATDFSIGYLCYQLLRAITAWSWTLTILLVWMRFLNFNNAVLAYAHQAVLPFYVLHYPVLAGMALIVSWLGIGILVQCLLTMVLSLLVTLALYDLLVRRIPVLRWFFGLKPEDPVHKGETPEKGRNQQHVPIL